MTCCLGLGRRHSLDPLRAVQCRPGVAVAGRMTWTRPKKDDNACCTERRDQLEPFDCQS